MPPPNCPTPSTPGAAAADGLLSLDEDALFGVLSQLDARSLARAGHTCSALRAAAASEALWAPHAAAALGVPPHLLEDAPQAGGGAAGAYAAARYAHTCDLCRQRMRRARPVDACGGARRSRVSAREPPCECTVLRRSRLRMPRVGKPPLVVASLSMDRVRDSGSVDWPPMRDALSDVLAPAFNLELRAAVTLDERLLGGAHVLVLNMTSAEEALSGAERECLQRYVQRGGVAILNAFSSWSANACWNEDVVGWLGVATARGAPFGSRRKWPVSVQTKRSLATLLDGGALLDGPFGSVRYLENVGATEYALSSRFYGAGGIARALCGGGRPGATDASDLAVLSHGPVGDGLVLLCSNMHWMVGEAGWHGGFLAASAAAPSAPDGHWWQYETARAARAAHTNGAGAEELKAAPALAAATFRAWQQSQHANDNAVLLLNLAAHAACSQPGGVALRAPRAPGTAPARGSAPDGAELRGRPRRVSGRA